MYVWIMYVLKRWPPSGEAGEHVSGITHPFQIKFQNYFTVLPSKILLLDKRGNLGSYNKEFLKASCKIIPMHLKLSL